MKRAGLAIPLVVLLTACGSLSRAATVTASAPAVPAAPRPDQLTGAQLAAALVPGSAFPHGYHYDNSNSFNSGNRLETGPVKYPLTSVSCDNFGNDFGQPGFGETAMAKNSYATGSDYTYDQAVYQFTSTSAARSWWHELHTVFVRCPGLGTGNMGPVSTSATQRFSAVRMPGAQAFRLDVTIGAKFAGRTAAVIPVNVCVAVDGQFVFETDGLGQGRHAAPTPETVMHALITRVLAA